MLAIGAVVILAAVLVYVALFLNRGATDSATAEPFPRTASGVAFIDEAVIFDDLGRMTASADLVVRGTVRDVKRGVTHTYGPGAGPDEVDRLLSVRVDDVVFAREAGGTVAAGAEISVIEGWWSEGVGFAFEGMPWSEPGDEGYFFLVADPSYAPGTYTYVGSTGRVLMKDAVARVSGGAHGDGPWDDRIAGVQEPGQPGIAHNGEAPRDVIEQKIADAARSASSGKAKPMPRPVISYPG